MLALILSVAPQAGTPPTFADSFYVGSQAKLVENQGGYKTADNAICCSFGSAACKVQQQSAGNDVHEQVSQNRTRIDGGRGSIVSWYGKVNKQMAVVPGAQANSTHKWACLQYCPIQGGFEPTLQIGDGKNPRVQDLGQTTVMQPKSIGGLNATCEHYKYVERLVIIPMSQNDFYVDQSTTPPTPFYKHLLLEPFGRKLGIATTYFLDYKPMDTSDFFDVDMDPKLCKLGSQCQQSEMAEMTTIGASERFFGRTLLDAAVHAAATRSASEAILVDADPPPPPNITFGGDFTAGEEMLYLINQGGVSGMGRQPADVCCVSDASQCQVQLQHSKGTRYFDLTNQRSRFDDDLAGSAMIDDYKLHKSYSVVSNATGDFCTEYCPIDPQDTMRPYDPFSPFDPIHDLGPTTIDGRPAEHYQWKEKVIHIITMSTTDFYADISDPKKAVPLMMSENLEPLGRHIGTNNRTWTNWTVGAPPAAKFAVSGLDTCPMAKNCRSSQMMAHYLRSRHMHTFARNMPDPTV